MEECGEKNFCSNKSHITSKERNPYGVKGKDHNPAASLGKQFQTWNSFVFLWLYACYYIIAHQSWYILLLKFHLGELDIFLYVSLYLLAWCMSFQHSNLSLRCNIHINVIHIPCMQILFVIVNSTLCFVSFCLGGHYRYVWRETTQQKLYVCLHVLEADYGLLS